LELLKAINDKSKCVVQMTLTTYDEDLCRKIEPNVATTYERFQALQAIQEAGIPTVVWIGPVLPFINDTEENLRGLLDYCVKAKVHGVLCFSFGVTMREGNREYFYRQLGHLFPGMAERYTRKFGNEYMCRSPNNTRLMNILRNTCERYGILGRSETVWAYLQEFESKEQQISIF
jgi:DNA repair photolyase